MTRRTRWFLVGSTLIVTGGLCTGLVAFYNGSLPGLLAVTAPGPNELSYIPQSATVVAYANVGEIMKSELRKHLQQAVPTGQGKDELQAEIGIDIEKDIDTVVAGFGVSEPQAGETPAQTAMNAATKSVILVRGRFDRAKIEAQAHQHGGTTETYKGKQLLEFDEHANAPGGPHAAATFLEQGLVAIGTIEEVREAIDAHDSGNNVRKNADLMKFVAGIDPLSNAWIAGRVDALAKNKSLPAEAQTRLAAVQWFAVTARVDRGVSGVMKAQARDDQSGEDLRAVVRGGIAAARLVGGQNPKLDMAMNSLQVSGNGKEVAVTFSVPPEVFDMAGGVVKSISGGK
jgi:hypothetical protein